MINESVQNPIAISNADKYVNPVIPAEAGIQKWLGYRIKPGMIVDMFNCRSNNRQTITNRDYGIWRIWQCCHFRQIA